MYNMIKTTSRYHKHLCLFFLGGVGVPICVLIFLSQWLFFNIVLTTHYFVWIVLVFSTQNMSKFLIYLDEMKLSYYRKRSMRQKIHDNISQLERLGYFILYMFYVPFKFQISFLIVPLENQVSTFKSLIKLFKLWSRVSFNGLLSHLLSNLPDLNNL